MTIRVFLALAMAFSSSVVVNAQDAREILDQAIDDFHQGRIRESITGFDEVIRLVPRQAPHLWQRGIALYYAGRFKDCRTQFESHRTVNPNDVENAAWHFLCVARDESPEKAKAALLPVGPDAREPMREIYRMFRGELPPDQVVAAGAGSLEAQFYAHLYVGLYYEALGKKDLELQHLRIAAQPQYSVGGYMHGVALVHLRLRR